MCSSDLIEVTLPAHLGSTSHASAAAPATQKRTKKAAVTRALEEFILRRKQKGLLDLMGKLEWDKSFDYKAERSRS